jgi:hypothetical protein
MANFRFFLDYVERKKTSMAFSVCPMQQNWRELPHFLEFCNGHGIVLFFNTVYYPEEHSLSSLAAEELENVIAFMQDVPMPSETTIQRRNRANYLGLITQIASFRDKALPPDYDDFTELDLGGAEWMLRAAKATPRT